MQQWVKGPIGNHVCIKPNQKKGIFITTAMAAPAHLDSEEGTFIRRRAENSNGTGTIGLCPYRCPIRNKVQLRYRGERFP